MSSKGLNGLHGMSVAVPEKVQALTAGIHLAIATQRQSRSRTSPGQGSAEDTAPLGIFQVDPVVFEEGRPTAAAVAAQAPRRTHVVRHGRGDGRPVADRTTFLGVIPVAMVEAVGVDPGQEQIAFLTAQVRDAPVMAVDEKLSQRRGTRTVTAGREDLADHRAVPFMQSMPAIQWAIS